MFGKPKDYILNLNSLTSQHQHLAGVEAIQLAELTGLGVEVPEAFVITATAFDDFITSADLHDRIAAEFDSIKLDDPSTLQLASKQITNMIMQANFPSLVLNPILHAYKNLSGFSDKYTAVKPAWVLSPQLRPTGIEEKFKLNVKGEAALLYAIKQVWAELFSEESIALNMNTIYDSGLSIAVVVQKMVQSEVSGIAYSYDVDADKEQAIVIEAVLGLGNDDGKIFPDIYKIDSSDMLIREKNVIAQDYMILRKGRAQPGEEPNMQVPISKEWQKRQKLDDQHVLELARLTHKLAEHFDMRLEIHWAVETNHLYLLSVSEAQQLAIHGDDLSIDSDLLNAAMNQDSEQFVEAAPNDLDIDSLAAEVVELAESGGSLDSRDSSEHEVDATNQPSVSELVKIDLNTPVPSKDTVLAPYELVTNICLDISNLETSTIAATAAYSGGFFDATSMLLRHRQLPEAVFSQKSDYARLIEAFTLEVFSAAKAVAPKSLIYRFSDIQKDEIAELAASDNDYELNGAERFVLHPEALIAEVLAVKKARTVYGYAPNILVLPHLRSDEDLLNMKKILSSQEVKKSSAFSIFAEVSVPSFVHSVDDLMGHDIDGLYVDLPALTKHMVHRPQVLAKDYKHALSALRFMWSRNAGKGFKLIIRVPMIADVIKQCLELPLMAVVMETAPEPELLKPIYDYEQGRLLNIGKIPNKRGRKPKSLL